MADISSIASSINAVASQQMANIGKATSSAGKSFSDTLSKVQSSVGIKPSTGFTSGATYESGTLTGKTKAALTSAVDATKSLLHLPR